MYYLISKILIKQIKHTSHWYGWHNYLSEENAQFVVSCVVFWRLLSVLLVICLSVLLVICLSVLILTASCYPFGIFLLEFQVSAKGICRDSNPKWVNFLSWTGEPKVRWFCFFFSGGWEGRHCHPKLNLWILGL